MESDPRATVGGGDDLICQETVKLESYFLPGNGRIYLPQIYSFADIAYRADASNASQNSVDERRNAIWISERFVVVERNACREREVRHCL